jgi:hypothetical protein
MKNIETDRTTQTTMNIIETDQTTLTSKETKSISGTHIYMTTHFSGMEQAP